MAKFRVKRRLKRKFLGNRHTLSAPTEDHADVNVSASAAKLGNLENNCEVPLQEPLLQVQQMKHQGMVCALLALTVGAGLTDRMHSVVNTTSTREAFPMRYSTK